jgi:hypothetical protein
MRTGDEGSMARAGLLAGLVGTLLVAMPFLSKLNCCCCALTILVGAFAAWMLRSDSHGNASAFRCALAGALSGLVSAVIGIPLHAVLSRLAFGSAHLEGQVAELVESFRQGFEQSGSPPPAGFLDALESSARAANGLDINGWMIVTTVFSAMVFMLFGLFGGVIGAGITQRSGATPPPSVPLPPSVPTSGPATGPASGPTTGPASGPAIEPPPPAPPSAAEPESVPDGEPADDAAQRGVGEIRADELPLLPPRPEPGPPDDEHRPA